MRACPGADCLSEKVAHFTCTLHKAVQPSIRLQPAYADHFNWCVVPDKGYDAILFGAMAVVLAVVLQGKYSALWTLIAGVSFDTAREYPVPSCRFTRINHLSVWGLCRCCSPSISLTFQNWSCGQRHCNLAGDSTCRPLPVHLLATYACGCSSPHRLLHLPQGKPPTPCWVHMPACISYCWAALCTDESHTWQQSSLHNMRRICLFIMCILWSWLDPSLFFLEQGKRPSRTLLFPHEAQRLTSMQLSRFCLVAADDLPRAGVCVPHSHCLHSTHDTHPAVCVQLEEQWLDVAARRVVFSHDSTHRCCLCLLNPQERYAQITCHDQNSTQLLSRHNAHLLGFWV